MAAALSSAAPSQTIYQKEWTGGGKEPQGTLVTVGQTAFFFDIPV